MSGDTRLDGHEAWSTLSPETQAAIGAAAIELVCCWVGLDAEPADHATPRVRILEASETALTDTLVRAIVQGVPEIDAEQVPLPASAVGAAAAPAEDPRPVPRCGDTVRVIDGGPLTGEEWEVAYWDQEAGYMSWAGWPEGRIEIGRVEPARRCSDDEHRARVASWLSKPGDSQDHRRREIRRLYGDAVPTLVDPAEPAALAADRAEWDAAPR